MSFISDDNYRDDESKKICTIQSINPSIHQPIVLSFGKYLFELLRVH